MPSDSQAEVLAQLRARWGGRVCLVGLGNPLKGDDGAGPALIARLADWDDALCIDAGVAPENHLEKIVQARPDLVVLVDALDFGGAPGEWVLLGTEGGEAGGLSSHALPLRLLVDYLHARLGRNPCILGIQPAAATLNAPLSPAVAEAVAQLASALRAGGSQGE